MRTKKGKVLATLAKVLPDGLPFVIATKGRKGLVWQNSSRAQTNFYTSIKSKAFYQRQKQAPFKKYHEISFSPHRWLHCQTWPTQVKILLLILHENTIIDLRY